MATETKKTKKHNWVTNVKIVDRDVDREARRFIDRCQHLTPAAEAELDNLFEMDRDDDAVIHVGEPSAAWLAEASGDRELELELEPGPEAFEFDEQAARNDAILAVRADFEA